MMPPCEVTKHEATGKPCPGEGIVTVPMLYRSGVSEQKRVCPHHAAQIEASNATVASERKERFGERAAESDDRASLLTAERPAAKPKAPRPSEHDGRKPYRSCRWGDCMKLGRVPLCNQHTARARAMKEDGDMPADFDAATAPHEAFETLWAARQKRIADRVNNTPTVADLAAGAEGPPAVEAQVAPRLPTAGEPGEPPTPPTEIEAVRAWAERAEAAIGKMEIERDELTRERDELVARLLNADRSQRGLGEETAALRCRQDLARVLGLRADDPALTEPWVDLLVRVSALEADRDRAIQRAADAERKAGEAQDAERFAPPRGEQHLWALPVLKYVAGQMLDDVQAAATDGYAPAPTSVRSLRAIVEGRVPEGDR